jgi:hypothetical protein
MAFLLSEKRFILNIYVLMSVRLRQLLDGQNTMFDHFCSFVDIPRHYAQVGTLAIRVGPPVVHKHYIFAAQFQSNMCSN